MTETASGDQPSPGPVLARLPRPRADPGVRLAVVADPHVAVAGRGGWKIAHRSRERFATAVADAAAHGVDALVLGGDLTEEGRSAEFDAVDEVLAGVDRPVAAIPGNHDVPKAFDEHDSPTVAAFADRYAPDDFPYTLEVGPLTLCCLNTASDPGSGDLRHTWGGRVDGRTREWLAATLPAVEHPIVVAHHNLGPLPENPGGKWANFPLRDAERTRDLLATHNVPLAVTAHHHVPAVARYGPMTELLAPATCSFPQAWLLVAVGPDGTIVRLVPAADGPGQAAAYRHATTGKALGRGIARMAADRLERLPLAER